MTEKQLNEINEELSQYKKWLDDFRIVGSGVSGHTRTSSSAVPTEQLGSFERLQERMAEVRGIVENFRIRGEGVSGSFQQGYKVGPAELGSEKGGVAGTIPPPPPSGCECVVQVTFHDVVLDCGCFCLNPPSHFGGLIATDGGIFNENPFTLCRVQTIEQFVGFGECGRTGLGPCPGVGSYGPGCYNENNDPTSPKWAKYQLNFTPDTENCTGGTDTPDSARINLAFLDGIWHLLVASFNGGVLLFYGTTSDLSLPIANLLTCSPSTFTDPCYDDDGCFGIPHGLNCAAWLTPHAAVSHDGHASITIVGESCGACCITFPEDDPFCLEMTESECTTYGIENGATTTWTPVNCGPSETCPE